MSTNGWKRLCYVTIASLTIFTLASCATGPLFDEVEGTDSSDCVVEGDLAVGGVSYVIGQTASVTQAEVAAELWNASDGHDYTRALYDFSFSTVDGAVVVSIEVVRDMVVHISYNTSPEAGVEARREYDAQLAATTGDWNLQSRGSGGSVDATIGEALDELVLNLDVACVAEVPTEINLLGG